MTRYLIEEAKCDVNLEDTLNQTCLFYVSRDGRTDLVKLLLRHGAKANHSDSYGQTPLFYAAREGHYQIMQALIEAGGDPDFIDNEGQTPVFYAVRMGKVESMEYLIENCEIDLQREDNFGNNLINVAPKRKAHLIEKLIQVGVSCPPEVKRKVLQTQQKARPVRGKRGAGKYKSDTVHLWVLI